MLHSGQSLRVFKRWCSDEKNMVIMPGFCVAGTVGAKVIAGMRKIDFDGKSVYYFIVHYRINAHLYIISLIL